MIASKQLLDDLSAIQAYRFIRIREYAHCGNVPMEMFC